MNTSTKNMVKTSNNRIISDPPLAVFLFNDTRFAWVWAVVRVLLGWEWFQAGWHKMTGGGWLDGGEALKGFWTGIVKVPETGRAPITYDWYRSFIQGLLDSGSYVWFAKLIAIGETAIGIALIIGMFVGIAAFMGAFMNWNFIMAGSASSNGLFLIVAVLLIMAWKTAGYWGVDRWLLPKLGTPWRSRDVEPETGQFAPELATSPTSAKPA